jgi:hypothetical protein
MQSQEQSSRRRWPSVIAAIKGSLGIAAAVLFWDVANEGCYGFSLLICPPWFLISFVKNIMQRSGWAIALLRVSMPLLTFAIAFGNGNLQWKVSDANAQRVITACEEFRVVNGRHPSELDELVPKYLTSVPPAKHCMMGVFSYRNSDGHCTLWWTRYGFYRRIYDFDEKRWSNLD